MDVLESILAQLGNRIQHALRAFTPNDADNLKKTVKTYPRSAFYEIDQVLTSMGIGQALVTVLNEKGIPTEVAVTHLTPPRSVMAPLPTNEFTALYTSSELYAKYKETTDPVSVQEILTDRTNATKTITDAEQQKPEPLGRQEKSTAEQVLNSPITKQIGKDVVRGLFGMLFGSSSRKK